MQSIHGWNNSNPLKPAYQTNKSRKMPMKRKMKCYLSSLGLKKNTYL